MRRLLLFALMLLSIQLFSETDQKAKSILDQVSNRTKSYASITASFDFIMVNKEVGLEESNKGTLIIQGEQYKLSITGIEILCDGKSQWTFMKDAAEVSITDAGNDEEGMLNPAKIFSIYEEGFNYAFLGESISNNKKIFKIDLIPTEVKEFSRVILDIDKDQFQIVNATMFGTDGNQYTIKVSKMETTKSYPLSIFVFDDKKYQGINVIDMR